MTSLDSGGGSLLSSRSVKDTGLRGSVPVGRRKLRPVSESIRGYRWGGGGSGYVPSLPPHLAREVRAVEWRW